jgi:OmpA-OmpF porin, OOP family
MRIRMALLVAGAMASLAAPAWADQPGWYVGGAGGFAKLQSLDSSNSSLDFNTSETNGFATLGFAGYDFGGIFRAEGEIGYRHHDVRSVTVVNDGGLGERLGVGSLTGASSLPSGTITALTFMLNGIVNVVPSWHRITPYIGGGFGAAHLSLNKLAVAGTTIADDSDTRIAGQGIAGIAARVAPRVSLGLEYRYFITANPSFNDTSGQSFQTKYREQDILLAVTYHFGAPPPPPPPVPAAAPPPPMPPPAPVAVPPPARVPPVFLVFFDFDKANLTPAGAKIVQQAAAAYSSSGAARINVTGYTDLVGSAAYNLQLSQRRAATVRRYLLTLGVPAAAIIEQGRGKQDPRVPTAEGVPNAENRRVEIVLP